MEKANQEVMLSNLAADAERAGINLAAILALVSAALKMLPQIMEIINQIKTVVPSPNSTPDGGFPIAK
jgi:hypothetical protein